MPVPAAGRCRGRGSNRSTASRWEAAARIPSCGFLRRSWAVPFVALLSLSTARQRWLDPAVEQPGNDQSDPDDEAEQAHHIDSGELADAFLPQLPEIGHHADREERQHKDDAAEGIGLAHRRLDLAHERRRRCQGEEQDQEEGHDISDDELGEALPDLAGPRRAARGLLDAGGPDIGQDERPYADEDVDEHLHRGRGSENPAFGIVDAFGCGFRQNQRFGDCAAGHRRAVGITESAIHAPATIGSCDRYACARKGRNSNSTTAKITTSEETMIATTGLARIAAPVAMAADTPQIEMPEES